MQESLKILQLISIIVCSVLLLLGIWVFLDNSNIYEQVMSELKLIPQITVIDFTTGPFSVFCKIRSRDSESARVVLRKIQSIDGIQRTETFLSMERNFKREKFAYRLYRIVNSIQYIWVV